MRLHVDALHAGTPEAPLVSADIRWQWPSGASGGGSGGGHCLVTWDVLGGGLQGNLLTDVPEVQLTLWPRTLYHVQVACQWAVSEWNLYPIE